MTSGNTEIIRALQARLRGAAVGSGKRHWLLERALQAPRHPEDSGDPGHYPPRFSYHTTRDDRVSAVDYGVRAASMAPNLVDNIDDVARRLAQQATAARMRALLDELLVDYVPPAPPRLVAAIGDPPRGLPRCLTQFFRPAETGWLEYDVTIREGRRRRA